ncbi:MAG: D-alanyl-D-alanine carboxypeptidase [Cyanobacteriota bacterium]
MLLPILQGLPPRRSLWAGIPLACSLALGACWTNRTGVEAPPPTQAVQAGSPTSAQNPFPPIPTPPPPLPSPTGTPGVPPWWPRSQAQVWEYSPYAVVLSGFLQGLAAQGGSLSQQGILLWTPEGDLLAEHLLDQPLPVGALDQLAISLMALETWGYDHRFETQFLTTGRLVDDRLVGDLIVVGSGDPYFKEADVQALARHLRNYDIRQIDGDVKVLPSFRLLGQPDPLASGRRLVTLLQEGDQPIAVTGAVSTVQQVPSGTHTLAVYTSMRLGSLLQILNGSDDPALQGAEHPRAMAETLLAQLGGKAALLEYLQNRLVAHPVSYMDAAMTPEAGDIRLEQGSQELHLSPRALAHLWEYLIDFTGGDPTRILPMTGIGHSTLRVRTLPLGTSAQVGFAADRLMVMGQLPDGTNFVLLNHGPDLDLLRQQQDQFLQDVLAINEPSRY